MADAIVAGGKNGVARRIPVAEEKFYVYLHSRLSTGEPFYIGKGNGKRARKRDGRTLHWKNIVKKDGGFHISFLVKDIDDEFSMLAEIEAIDIFRRRGCALVNFTDGGEGCSGRKQSTEMRAKLSAERKGKPLSPQTMAGALAFHLGSKHSPEQIEKHIAHLRGKSRPPEVVKKIADGNRGQKRSDEARANMSKAHIGKPTGRKGVQLSDEQRARLSVSHLGKTHSAETKAKMSASHRARLAKKSSD